MHLSSELSQHEPKKRIRPISRVKGSRPGGDLPLPVVQADYIELVYGGRANIHFQPSEVGVNSNTRRRRSF